MAATYRGRTDRSTGSPTPITLAIALCVGACASPPPERYPGAPRTEYAFIERVDAPPAVLSRSKGGVWIIQRGVLTTDRRGTPRSTVRAFVEALEASDFARLREFAPLELRQDMTVKQLREQIESDSKGTSNMLQRLKPHLDAPIIVKGAHASMEYAGALFEMRFEEGRWVVLDPD